MEPPCQPCAGHFTFCPFTPHNSVRVSAISREATQWVSGYGRTRRAGQLGGTFM